MMTNNKTLRYLGRLCVLLICFLCAPPSTWAQTYTEIGGISYSAMGSKATDMPVASNGTEGTTTGSAGETWDISVAASGNWASARTGSAANGYYWQIGTNKGGRPTSVTFSTSGISGAISKVAVTCAGSSSATLSVSVGGTDFTTTNTISSWSNNKGGTMEFKGSGTGEIKVAITPNSANFYIQSITVYKTESSTSDPTFSFDPTGNLKIGGTTRVKSTNTSTSFTLTASPSGIVSISGDEITGASAGTATIYATQAAATGFNAISNKQIGTITVDANTTPTITPNTDQSLGIGANLTITSDSPGALTVTSSNTSVASVSGATISALAEGTTTISVTQAEATGFNAVTTPVTFTLTVTEAAATATATGNLNNGSEGVFYGLSDNTTGSGTLSTTAGNVTVTYESGSNKYLNENEVRLYANSTLTFAAPLGYVITSITLTQGGKGKSQKALTVNEGTWSTDAFTTGSSKTWTGNTNSVTFTGESGNGNTSLTTASVTIQKAGTVTASTTLYIKADYAPYVYTWEEGSSPANEYNGSWPGVNATETETLYGTEWYKATVPADAFNLIMHNNMGGDANKTATIAVTGNTYFFTNSASPALGANQYMVVDPTATPVSAANVSVQAGNNVAANVTNSNNLTLAYSSSNTSIATVATDGTVTGVAEGSATITVSWEAQGTVNGTGYLAGSVTFTANVAAAPVPDIEEDDEKIVYSFASNDNWGFQEGDTNATGENTYTGYSTTTTSDAYKTITLNASVGYRKYGSGIIIGKTGAYLQLPVFAFDVALIEVVGASGASGSVTQNIYVGDNAASTACTGSKGTNSYEIAEDYQGAGNVYKIQATNNNNMQITKITVYKKTSSTVTKPVASPVGGTYQTAQTVTLTSETNQIYYTTDGSDPKLSSTHATSPVTVAVNNSLTLRYIAYNGTEWSSEGIVQTYVIKPATPTLSPASGTFSSATNVIAGCSTANVTLHYTTDGSEPTASSPTTTGSIAVEQTCTVKVVAIDGNGNVSDVASGSYTITSTVLGTTQYQLVTDASQIAEGNSYILVGYYNGNASGVEKSYVAMGGQNTNFRSGVAVTVENNICDIADASSVTVLSLKDLSNSSKWALLLQGETTNNKQAYLKGNVSATSSQCGYLLQDDGTTEDVDQWTITSDGTGYIVKNVNSSISDRRLSINTGNEGYRIGNYKSEVTGFVLYLYVNTAGLAAPIITPATGTYTEAQEVSISGPEGATIYYTTDGTDPTNASTEYTGSFNVSKTTTIKAIAYKDDTHSTITTATLTFYVQPPVFSEANGSTFSEEFNIDITSPQGYTIYYRLYDDKIYGNVYANGQEFPTADQTTKVSEKASIYSGTLTLAQNITISAVCVDPAGNISTSTVVTYKYTSPVKPTYQEKFSKSAGAFTAEPSKDDAGSGPYWRVNSNTGQTALDTWGEERWYEYINGGNNTTDTKISRYYGTAHFTSPVIDLTDSSLSDPYFNFIHAGHGFYSDPNKTTTTNTALETTLDDEVAKKACNVYIGVSDAEGNVETWTLVSHDKYNMFHQTFHEKAGGPGTTTTTSTDSRKGEFERMNSGNIDLSEYLGKYIRVRFTFESTEEYHGTWNLDEFNVYASAVEKFTMNDYGWSTYVVDHDIDMYQTTQNYTAAGKVLKVYKVPQFDQNTVVLQQLGLVAEHVEGTDNSERYVKAGTPIVIQGPAGVDIDFVESEYTGIIKPVQDNLLKGSLAPNTVKQSGDARLFILTIRSGMTEPFFNKISNNREIPDHRAYLDGINEVEAITLTKDEANGRYFIGQNQGTTGIDNINTEATENTGKWYTLQGLEVAQPTKGIYIHNGRKVIIK